MGYNYAEAFQNEPDQPNQDQLEELDQDQTEELTLSPEFILIKQRLELLRNKVYEFAKTEDKEVIQYVKFLLHKDVLSRQQEILNTLIEELSDQSDTLINSPQAQTPEGLKARKEIANQINELMLIDEDLKQDFIEQEKVRKITQLIPEDKKNRGHEIVAILRKDMENLTALPPEDLN